MTARGFGCRFHGPTRRCAQGVRERGMNEHSRRKSLCASAWNYTFTVSVLHSCEPVSLATRELSVEAHFSFSRTPIACMNLLYCYAIQRPAVVYTYWTYELYSCIQLYACALLRVLRADRGARKNETTARTTYKRDREDKRSARQNMH